MKYYIVVGEASGDLHGSNLMKEIYKKDADADIRFWGGDLMKEVGGELVLHYKERAFMGFVEVLFNLRKILKFISRCKKDISSFNPDVVVLIDNSGFNLRVAKWAKEAGFKTHYYISPQVWASRPGRVKSIKRDVDALYSILPFEKDFYKKYNYDVHYVGHPLIDGISNRKQIEIGVFKNDFQLSDKKIISLLPGSRKQEIQRKLPVMLAMVKEFPTYQFVIAGAPGLDKDYYNEFVQEYSNVTLIHNRTYDLLSVSYAAIVTSGTATLETALFKVPQVVCYQANNISYQIAKRIITIKYISLVNLILDKKVVTELIQDDFNKDNLKFELKNILDPKGREAMFLSYFELEEKLGGRGASEKTAIFIVNALS